MWSLFQRKVDPVETALTAVTQALVAANAALAESSKATTEIVKLITAGYQSGGTPELRIPDPLSEAKAETARLEEEVAMGNIPDMQSGWMFLGDTV